MSFTRCIERHICDFRASGKTGSPATSQESGLTKESTVAA